MRLSPSYAALLGFVGVFFLSSAQATAQCAAGAELAQTQSQLGEVVLSSLNKTWGEQLSGQLYHTLSQVGATFALLTIGWYALKVIKVQVSHADITLASLEEWGIAVLLTLLLLNPGNGSLLGTISLGFRDFTIGISNTLIQQISSASNDIVNQGQAKLTLEAWANDQAKLCGAIVAGETRNQCFITATDSLAQKLSCYQNTSWGPQLFQYYQTKFLQSTSNPGDYGTSDFMNRLFGGLGTLANTLSSSVIISWLAAVGASLLILVDTAMLLIAQMGPIFLGLSFLPVPVKPIQIWVTGLGGLAMVEIAYKILVGIVSSTMIAAPPTDPLMWQLMIAVLSPLLILAMAGAGGVAFLNGLGRGATSIVHLGG